MTLSNTEILRMLRQKVTEVDPGTYSYEGEDLVVALGDALIHLQAKNVRNMNLYTVNTDPTVEPLGITPEPEAPDALIIMLHAAVELLSNEYRGRLKRGEMGISWRSGLEEESSITAAKEYRAMVAQLENDLTALILIHGITRHGARIQ